MQIEKNYAKYTKKKQNEKGMKLRKANKQMSQEELGMFYVDGISLPF